MENIFLGILFVKNLDFNQRLDLPLEIFYQDENFAMRK